MILLGRLRTGFVTGLVLVTPLAVTLFVLQAAFTRLTGVLNPIVTTTRLTTYTNDVHLVAQLVAATVLVACITLLGLVASQQAGRRLFGGVERAIRFVPVVRTIYFGVRQVGESLLSRSESYESVVLVEQYREGVYSVGFVTSESPSGTRVVADEPLYNVFLPNSPNPTAGRLVMVPESEVHEVDIPVREGLRLLVTTGLTVDELDEEDLPDAVSERPENDRSEGDRPIPAADGAGS